MWLFCQHKYFGLPDRMISSVLCLLPFWGFSWPSQPGFGEGIGATEGEEGCKSHIALGLNALVGLSLTHTRCLPFYLLHLYLPIWPQFNSHINSVKDIRLRDIDSLHSPPNQLKTVGIWSLLTYYRKPVFPLSHSENCIIQIFQRWQRLSITLKVKAWSSLFIP